MTSTSHHEFCYNCGIRLSGAFCASCGQKSQDLNPSFHHFAHDLTHELLHVDGKIFRSVRTLLAKPGVLTLDYFEGRRVRWISAIRLYLIFSVVYFAVITQPGMRERALRIGTYVMGVVLVPVFAWLTQLATRRSGWRFPQHLVFALHVHAVWFGAFALMELTRIGLSHWLNTTRPVGWIVTAYVCVYTLVAFRTAYRETLIASVLKMGAIMLVYAIVLVVAILGVSMAIVVR